MFVVILLKRLTRHQHFTNFGLNSIHFKYNHFSHYILIQYSSPHSCHKDTSQICDTGCEATQTPHNVKEGVNQRYSFIHAVHSPGPHADQTQHFPPVFDVRFSFRSCHHTLGVLGA